MLTNNEKPKINSIQIAIILSGLIASGLFYCATAQSTNTLEETPIFKLKSTEINEQNHCKVVYVTENKQCKEKCTENSWDKWSHKLFRAVMNDAYHQISCDVVMGSTYDFEFDINNKKQVSNISITHRFGDDDSVQLLTKNIKNNLFTLKESISKLNENPILNYPPEEKRTNTKILGAIQIVDNTIFVHVIQTSIP